MEYKRIIYNFTEAQLDAAAKWVGMVYPTGHLTDCDLMAIELAQQLINEGETIETIEELVHSWAEQWEEYQAEQALRQFEIDANAFVEVGTEYHTDQI